MMRSIAAQSVLAAAALTSAAESGPSAKPHGIIAVCSGFALGGTDGGGEFSQTGPGPFASE